VPAKAIASVVVRAIRRLNVRTVLPEPLAPLDALAHNLRWSWHQPTRDLFAAMDPEIWDAVNQDPMRLLAEVSSERLEELAGDQGFVDWVNHIAGDLADYLDREHWYQHREGNGPRAIAYFSPEFGVAAALPQYSGGLGILAGDHLKAASDIGVPIIGVGLFYRSGYFRQALSRDGWQTETYPVLDPDSMPLQLLRDDEGNAVYLNVGMPGGRSLDFRIWVAQVGRVPLLMMDSDVATNAQPERDVTDRLYGGGHEHRLRQEMLLGIGGVRAVRRFCEITGHSSPEVFHSNEGHAGFLGLERIRELMGDPGLPFDEALEVVRAGTVFTTHTPVPAGIDRFPRELIEQYFTTDTTPALPIDRVLALGAEDYEGGDPGVFNMAVMGLRLSQRANGVSLLHGAVSRSMFNGLWPDFDAPDVPITSITNGVHAPTWTAPEIWNLAVERGAEDLAEQPYGWELLGDLPDDTLWWTKRTLRERLVHMARQRMRKSWIRRGATEAELGWIDGVLDPDVLTIGFARRVPSYKRLTLMLRDPERLRSLLLDPERPIQVVVAGKAHPDDEGGKRLIQQLVRFSDDPEVRHRIAFLPNYEIAMATVLYPGCDVWLNNPIRPLEASGTSGMKAALNGALNLSILDGWWDEWFDGENGWAIPTANGVDDPERRDDLEAAALYDLIESSVAPTFYGRGDDDIPHRWVEMMRHTLKTLGPKVLASRMVREYVERLYVPAADASREVLNDGMALGRELASWKTRVRAQWHSVAVEHVDVSIPDAQPALGVEVPLRAYVHLGELAPDDVRVQVVFGRVDLDDVIAAPTVVDLAPAEAYDGGRWRFDGQMPLDRTGPFGYTVRVLPRHEGLASIADMGLIRVPVPTATA
jgi:glycogen phosphorylase